VIIIIKILIITTSTDHILTVEVKASQFATAIMIQVVASENLFASQRGLEMEKMTVDPATVNSHLGIRAAKPRHLESTVLTEVTINIIKINAITPEINSLP